MAINKSNQKLIQNIDKELKAVKRDIDFTLPKKEDLDNRLLSYKMLVLGVVIGIFGNVIASALWEPNMNLWQFIVVILSIIILFATVIFTFESLRK